MSELDRALDLPTPPCPHCGQPLPLPPHLCDAIAIAASVARVVRPPKKDPTDVRD